MRAGRGRQCGRLKGRRGGRRAKSESRPWESGGTRRPAARGRVSGARGAGGERASRVGEGEGRGGGRPAPSHPSSREERPSRLCPSVSPKPGLSGPAGTSLRGGVPASGWVKGSRPWVRAGGTCSEPLEAFDTQEAALFNLILTGSLGRRWLFQAPAC